MPRHRHLRPLPTPRIPGGSTWSGRGSFTNRVPRDARPVGRWPRLATFDPGKPVLRNGLRLDGTAVVENELDAAQPQTAVAEALSRGRPRSEGQNEMVGASAVDRDRRSSLHSLEHETSVLGIPRSSTEASVTARRVPDVPRQQVVIPMKSHGPRSDVLPERAVPQRHHRGPAGPDGRGQLVEELDLDASCAGRFGAIDALESCGKNPDAGAEREHGSQGSRRAPHHWPSRQQPLPCSPLWLVV